MSRRKKKYEYPYRWGMCVVKYTYRRDGSRYCTVINLRTQKHRHYDFLKQAVMICKRAGKGELPVWYSASAKKDILYLI